MKLARNKRRKTFDIAPADSTPDDSEINNTFELLKRGEEKIELSENRDIVLALGNTGSGKSTFIQWLAGDNNKLIAKEASEGAGQFIIVDENRIGHSTIMSKTIFPELAIDVKTRTAYYDCPGFSDTRSTSHDIATTYFIKKLTDHAERVKLVFVVSFPAVSKGVDRQDFMKFLGHVTDLVLDIDKFKRSIALAVTKVNNEYVKRNGILVPVADDKFIESIADFMQEVKQGFEETLQLTNISSEKRKFYQKASKLLDILLIKVNDRYARIGIFRRPDEAGPVSSIRLLQEGKQLMENIVHKNLDFSAKEDSDFGYTISDKSRNEISKLVEEINKNILSDMKQVSKQLKEHFQGLIEQTRNKINSLASDTNVIVKKSEAKELSSKLKNGKGVTLNLVQEIEKPNVAGKLAENIVESVRSLDFNISGNYINDIVNQEKYFQFLQIVDDRKLNFQSGIFAGLFAQIVTYLSDSDQKIRDDSSNIEEKINNRINSNIVGITKEIQDHYEQKMEILEVRELLIELKQGHEIILKAVREIENLTGTTEIIGKLNNVNTKLNMNSPKIRSYISNISHQVGYSEYLQVASYKSSNSGHLDWVTSFNAIAKYLCESEKWYKFLSGLYDKFSEYPIQEDTNKYNVAQIEGWGNRDTSQGITVSENNFKQFFGKVRQYNIAEYDAVKDIKITNSRLLELNNVLNLTLKHRMNILCSGPNRDELVIKGDYVKFSQFIGRNGKINELCSTKIKSVNVFALNTVFIDRNLEAKGEKLNLAVIAPKWEIVGSIKIVLDGTAGSYLNPATAQVKGVNGMPGLPGSSAGNFFGVGEKFINGSSLKINANGGKGGTGQNGANGGDGSNGSDASPPSQNGCKMSGRYELVNSVKGSSNPWGLPSSKTSYFKIYGTSGNVGGSGGNGGVGGVGGEGGNITLIYLNTISNISVMNNKGNRGEPGTGGTGGNGGRAGNDVRAVCYSTFGDSENMQLDEDRKYPNNEIAASGQSGTAGSHETGIQYPETVVQKSAQILNNYKTILRENLSDRYKKYSLTEFSNKMNRNDNIGRIKREVNDNMESLRYPRAISGDDLTAARSTGSLVSSPMNVLFSWLKSSIMNNGESCPRMHAITAHQINGHWESQSKGFPRTHQGLNAVSATVDSFLILGTYAAAYVHKAFNGNTNKHKVQTGIVLNSNPELTSALTEYEEKFRSAEINACKIGWGEEYLPEI